MNSDQVEQAGLVFQSLAFDHPNFAASFGHPISIVQLSWRSRHGDLDTNVDRRLTRLNLPTTPFSQLHHACLLLRGGSDEDVDCGPFAALSWRQAYGYHQLLTEGSIWIFGDCSYLLPLMKGNCFSWLLCNNFR